LWFFTFSIVTVLAVFVLSSPVLFWFFTCIGNYSEKYVIFWPGSIQAAL